MSRSLDVASLVSVALVVLPTVASACAVSRQLPPAIMAAEAEREGRAWATAPLVYVAQITGVASNYESYELTPRRVLKGEARAPVLNVPSAPSRGMCIIYHGLNVSDGAAIGDEFIVYALSEPARANDLYIVSARMLGDPSTRAALTATRRRN